MKKSIVPAILLLTLCVALLPAAHAAWRLLDEKQIVHFADTFPPMYREYRKMGLRIDPQTGDVDGMERIKHDKLVHQILKEHGWGAGFWPRLQVIVRGYSVAKYDQALADGSQLDSFVRDLRDAPWMTAEKRAELDRFYAQLQADFADDASRLRAMVHEKDLALIKESIPALDTVMTEVTRFEIERLTVRASQDGTAGRTAELPAGGNEVSEPDSLGLQDDISNNPEIVQILGSVNSPRSRVEAISILRVVGGRVAWSPNGDLIAIDQKGEDNYYDIYLIGPDGGGERCLTCDTDGAVGSGHNGQPAWHPSGRYLVFQSQKKHDVGNWGRDIAAQPGFGRHNDLWLLDLETGRFHQLTDTTDSNDTGVLHPHFSKDGRTLTWSEMHTRPGMLGKHQHAGYWKLKVAEFSITGGTPELSSERSFEPGGKAFYENHGLSPDGTKLIFTANFDGGREFLKATKIYLYDLAHDELQMIAGKGYNEHAQYLPRQNRILWMTSMRNTNRGTDYWVMNADGSAKSRLTDFNNARLPSYRRKLIVAADSSFSPDGSRLAAYLQTNLLTQEGPLVLIELKPGGN